MSFILHLHRSDPIRLKILCAIKILPLCAHSSLILPATSVLSAAQCWTLFRRAAALGIFISIVQYARNTVKMFVCCTCLFVFAFISIQKLNAFFSFGTSHARFVLESILPSYNGSSLSTWTASSQSARCCCTCFTWYSLHGKWRERGEATPASGQPIRVLSWNSGIFSQSYERLNTMITANWVICHTLLS
jgi:hypothetical protein